MHHTITKLALTCSLFTACTDDLGDEDFADVDVDVDETSQELVDMFSIWGRISQNDATSSGKCLDAQNAASGAGTKIQLYNCSDAQHKTFQVRTRPGQAPIRADYDNEKRIDTGFSNRAGLLTLNTPTASLTQQWRFVDNEIKAVGNCLDIPPLPSPQIAQMFPCHSINRPLEEGANQKWTYDETIGQIKLRDGRCLHWVSANQNSSVVVEPCNTGLTNQKWRHRGDGHFVAGTTNLCLNVANANPNPNAVVQLYPCHEGDRASRFYISGVLQQQLTNQLPQCLGLPTSTTNPGQPDLNNGVQPLMEACDRTALDQRWTLSWSSNGNP